MLTYNEEVSEWLTRANQSRTYRFLRQFLPQLNVVLQVLGTERTQEKGFNCIAFIIVSVLQD